MWFVALFSVVISGVLIAFSICPGLLEQLPGRPALIVGAVFALLIGGLALWHLIRPARPDRRRRRATAIIALAAAIMTPVLLLTHAPRRVVFSQYRSDFEALVANAPPPGGSVANLNADLSPFWVDQWGTDVRGGIYLRTMVGAAPARKSFGFVHRPNADGSPFGDAEYELQHLGGDWYSFAASDR